eukprot:gene48681-22539_t
MAAGGIAAPSRKCMRCGHAYPGDQLEAHLQTCGAHGDADAASNDSNPDNSDKAAVRYRDHFIADSDSDSDMSDMGEEWRTGTVAEVVRERPMMPDGRNFFWDE